MSELPRVVPATVTPLSEGGERLLLDFIPQHLAYLEHRGADGVLALGTNGEGPSLSLEERKEVIDAVLTHRGRLRTLFGTGCAALPETIDLSRYAIEHGADALMIVPPFYFKGVSNEGVASYYEAVFSALPAERKVILYNIPATSGIEISDELVDALLAHYPDRLLGIKDTSGSIERTRRYLERYPQLAVYNGNDGNVGAAAEAGVAGAISAVANVFPDLIAWVFRAQDAGGDVAGAQAEVTRLRQLIDRYPSHSVIKHLLHLVAGLPLTHVRPPLRDLTPAEAGELAREVAALEIG
ncbi:MAG: dihydrodipicolinate synthase family protein [Dehalococcoidia bacterium]|nr:dihydrodipicolinate synthase family protein [Dehalococcoidia bacterium]